jgi:hypothetical protein
MLSTISSLIQTSEMTGLYTDPVSSKDNNNFNNNNFNNKNYNNNNIINNNNTRTEHDLLQLYRNITNTLAQMQKLRPKEKDKPEPYYDDNTNAW